MRKPHRIKVVTAFIETPFCPTTYIGHTAESQTVYARYRWGVLSVRFDPRNPAPHKGSWGLILMEAHLGEQDDGHMSYEELREHSKNVVTWPDDLSQIPEDDPEPQQ